MEFGKEIKFIPAFDRRNPDPHKNYGVHGMEIRFHLIGPKGVVQFVVYTNMHLPKVSDELWEKTRLGSFNPFRPMGADIGYHSHTPQYEGQRKMDDCQFIEGGCYYDGSSLQAEEFMPTFLSGGEDAVWKMLEERYKQMFGEGDYNGRQSKSI